MKRYFYVDRNTMAYEREIDEAKYSKLFKLSETEQNGYAKIVDAIIIESEDDANTFVMYLKGSTWYSVPAAFSGMTINFEN